MFPLYHETEDPIMSLSSTEAMLPEYIYYTGDYISMSTASEK